MKKPRTRKGLTLVEVMISVVIVAISGIGIISSIAFGIYLKQSIMERNSATRVAADALEQCKRTLFLELEGYTETDVLIDDRGTATNEDDIEGTLEVSYLDDEGYEVGTEYVSLPDDGSMVLAKATVTWYTAGRRSSEPQTVKLMSLLAP